jgi:hypothetical protein
MVYLNKKVIDNGNTSSDIISEVVDISLVNGFCVHAISNGTMNGQIEIHASNDGINFVTLSVSDIVNSTQYMLNYETSHFIYVRVRYKRLGGGGNITVYVSGKSFKN